MDLEKAAAISLLMFPPSQSLILEETKQYKKFFSNLSTFSTHLPHERLHFTSYLCPSIGSIFWIPDAQAFEVLPTQEKLPWLRLANS